jgi:RHS repeat-associated protein
MRRVTRVTGPVGTDMITENVWQNGLVTKVRRAKVANPNFATDNDWQVWTKFYTATDKIDREVDPENSYVDTDYDPLDRPLDVKQYLGPNDADRITRTLYDGAGRVWKIYKAWGTADEITYAENGYTLDGQIAWTKDADFNQTNFAYDGYNRLWHMCTPGTTNCETASPSGGAPPQNQPQFEAYTYDDNGNLTKKKNRSGRFIEFAFDALNREYVRNVDQISPGPGPYARTLTTGYDLAGHKLVLTADGQTLTSTYNSAAQLMKVADSLLNQLGTNAGNVEYLYDSDGNRSQVKTYSSANSMFVNYAHDAAERLTTISNNSGTLMSVNSYDPLSRVSGQTYLDSTSVGYSYEADDDLASLTQNYSTTGGAASLALGLTHNGAHQLVGTTSNDSFFFMKTPNANVAYTSNSLNQYTQVGAATLTYDLNGNLTGDGTWAYWYDEENRLRKAVGSGTTALYDYDPMGRRRSKTVGSTITYFVNDGPSEFQELTAAGGRLRLYANSEGMDQHVAMWTASTGVWSFYHSNHQGSVLFTTTAGIANTSEEYRYGLYGEPALDTPSTGNPIRYTGRYFDSETGLYYYRARFYSVKLGRFLQTDPIGTKDDLNLYAYVRSDPINNLDPNGTCTGSHIEGKGGTCASTGGYTTDLNGAAQGMARGRSLSLTKAHMSTTFNVGGAGSEGYLDRPPEQQILSGNNLQLAGNPAQEYIDGTVASSKGVMECVTGYIKCMDPTPSVTNTDIPAEDLGKSVGAELGAKVEQGASVLNKVSKAKEAMDCYKEMKDNCGFKWPSWDDIKSGAKEVFSP